MYISNLPVFKPWKKLGYTIVPHTPNMGGVFSVHAVSPVCTKYKLWIVLDSGKVVRVVVVQAPVKPKRAWLAVAACEGKDWSRVPAAWLYGKVEQAIREANTNGDEEKAEAHG